MNLKNGFSGKNISENRNSGKNRKSHMPAHTRTPFFTATKLRKSIKFSTLTTILNLYQSSGIYNFIRTNMTSIDSKTVLSTTFTYKNVKLVITASIGTGH